MLRETRDDYLVLIRSEKFREIIERHVPAESLDRITYVMGGLRRPRLVLRPGMRICSGDRRDVLFLPTRNVLALKAVKFREACPNFPQLLRG
ncbi:hypothetical protein [Desulfonatronum parangueonense]